MNMTGHTLVLAAALLSAAGSASAVTMDFVTVGDPGNYPYRGYFGTVNTVYKIGREEVTNAQYAQFLNAVDADGSNPRALYNGNMSSSPLGGIDFNSANAPGSKYSIKAGHGNNPVVFVSWNDAARMSNWMNNGQGAADTESGAYTFTSKGNVTGGREAGATFFLPTDNEWFKAAYYEPGADQDGYWRFPTRTNTEINSVQPPGSGSIQYNAANYYNVGFPDGANDGYAVTGSQTFDPSQNYLTDVGAYFNSASYYGTYDQAGNVLEWNESGTTVQGTPVRFLRGGSWGSSGDVLLSSEADVSYLPPTFETNAIGFRLATTVPEPSTLALLGLGFVLAARRRRPAVI